MTAINYGEVKKVLVTLEAQSLEKYNCLLYTSTLPTTPYV